MGVTLDTRCYTVLIEVLTTLSPREYMVNCCSVLRTVDTCVVVSGKNKSLREPLDRASVVRYLCLEQ